MTQNNEESPGTRARATLARFAGAFCGAFAAVFAASLLVAGMAAAIGGAVAHATEGEQSPYRNLSLFGRALSHIEVGYVEPPDQDELIYGAIRGMVGTLDPHSAFMDPEEYRILSSDTEGRFGGIGVEISVRDGWLTVVGVFEGGPADEAGVRVGDRFLVIENRNARDLPMSEAVRIMRGEPGTRVRVALRREGREEAVEVTLVRRIIRVDAVESRLLADRVLYLRLKAFQGTTTDEMRRAIDEAVARSQPEGGLRGILLDLRRNPGGLLNEAVRVSDEFLSSGAIVSTRGRGGRVLSEARAHQTGTRPDWPIVVLVDGFTASAAEIVAGALRDHRRAVLVGTRTWGKGSVQNVIELPGGSALKLTVARYYTPSGRSIQAEGIEPDVVVEQPDEETTRRLVRSGARFSEASLERHLSGQGEGPIETEEAEAGTTAAEEAPRRAPARDEARVEAEAEAEDALPFADDFQARMGHQVLRALIVRDNRGEGSEPAESSRSASQQGAQGVQSR